MLGQTTPYLSRYTPSLLFSIPRREKREEIGIGEHLPFMGVDIWNAYEVSWLNLKGKPEIAFLEIIIQCDSPNIVESKSLKLYLNSLNQTQFSSHREVKNIIVKDLEKLLESEVIVTLKKPIKIFEPWGKCLDHLDIEVKTYQPTPELLKIGEEVVEERLTTNLLKSNCPVTEQPDWATLMINYRGLQIDHSSLLEYIVSFREHCEFHEQCIERIYVDLLNNCRCQQLTVYGRYTRRGGIDINPYRSNFEKIPSNYRVARQ